MRAIKLIPARATKCLDHIQMIAASPVERFRKRMCVRPDSVDLLCQQIDGFDQTGIAAKAEQDLMKTQVAVKDGQQITFGNGRAVLPL